MGEAEPGWAARCTLSTRGRRDGALTPACALRGDPRRILQTLCGALHPKLGGERSTLLILRATPKTHPLSKLVRPCLLNQLGLELKGLIK